MGSLEWEIKLYTYVSGCILSYTPYTFVYNKKKLVEMSFQFTIWPSYGSIVLGGRKRPPTHSLSPQEHRHTQNVLDWDGQPLGLQDSFTRGG